MSGEACPADSGYRSTLLLPQRKNTCDFGADGELVSVDAIANRAVGEAERFQDGHITQMNDIQYDVSRQ